MLSLSFGKGLRFSSVR